MSAPFGLHVLGASGSGTTTLGRLLAAELALAHVDTDDFFWEPTDPPYEVARPVDRRLASLRAALDRHARWVLSGSLCGWGDSLIPRFDAVVFVTLPAAVRLERARRRERERYGARIDAGGALHEKHVAFMAWSAGYDEPAPTVGRSRVRHEAWLAALSCPVVRVENTGTPRETLEAVVARLPAPGRAEGAGAAG